MFSGEKISPFLMLQEKSYPRAILLEKLFLEEKNMIFRAVYITHIRNMDNTKILEG